VELESFIDWLKTNHHIDPARIYLTGLSMGAFGVWDLCQRQPTRYAAIVPISAAPDSSPSSPNYTLAPALHDLPIWAFHGANDPLYSVAQLQSYLDLIRNAGGSPLVTIYTTSPGNVHDAWVPTYANDDWCNWLLQH
jgi:predicted peptidase